MRVPPDQAVTPTPSCSEREQNENEAGKHRQETVHTLEWWSAPHSGRFIPGTHRTGDRVGLTVGLDAVRVTGVEPFSRPVHDLVSPCRETERVRIAVPV